MPPLTFITIDVEEWFNILDIPGEIEFSRWGDQEARLEKNLNRMLELFRRHNVRTTMFWLGYFAEKYPHLVRACVDGGHEIGSHGYAHVLAFKVGREKFREDIRRGKQVLEGITGKPVLGFRAAGFSTTTDSLWAFDEIRAAGYLYDSSIFPATRNHGGIAHAELVPHIMQTEAGPLWEIPQSVIEIGGKRISLFGGGYFRLAPLPFIKWGIRQLEKQNRPFILYLHPREIDPEHPKLKMNALRTFKSYVNLNTTYHKLEFICKYCQSQKMEEYFGAQINL